MKENKKEKYIPLTRINTRIRPDQYKYTQNVLKKRNKMTAGELHREIFDYYINNHKI